MDLLIRDAVPADAEAIAAILNAIIAARVYSTFDTTVSVEDERDYIARLPARGIWKVAVRQPDDRVVGFQILEPFASYTAAFDHVGTLGTFVDLTQRRRAIATRLFEATFEAARERGYEKLFTFVRADNPVALATYLSQGFAVIGTARRHARIDGHYIDEVFIEKELASGRGMAVRVG